MQFTLYYIYVFMFKSKSKSRKMLPSVDTRTTTSTTRIRVGSVIFTRKWSRNYSPIAGAGGLSALGFIAHNGKL